MEVDLTLNSQPQLMALDDKGLALLKETTEAVRSAISKLNAFKQHLKDSVKISRSPFPQKEGHERTVIDSLRLNHLSSTPTNPLVNVVDSHLRVFFTIQDCKITESEVREAFEKEGFEDFVITIKNRTDYSFGFIKFSSKLSVDKALGLNQKISVNNQLIKIKPDKNSKSNSVTSLTSSNDDPTNNLSQTIDESLLINVSSGYHNRRILSNHSEQIDNQFEENEVPMSAETELSSFVDLSVPGTPQKIMTNFTDSFKENENSEVPIQPLISNLNFFSRMHINETKMEWDRNNCHEEPAPPESQHSSGRNGFSHCSRGRNFTSRKSLRNKGSQKCSPGYFNKKRSKKNNVNCYRGGKNYGFNNSF